ncbi:7610_t:CDS:1, partial [Funneliformis geosporum]
MSDNIEPNRKRQKTSLVWKFFEIRNNHPCCLLCPTPKIYGPKTATSTLQRHLDSIHNQEASLKTQEL